MFDRKKYMKEWRKHNLEYIKKYNKKYHKDNSKKQKEYYKKWLEENPNYKKQWYLDNHKRLLEKHRKWQKDNSLYVKQYRKDNSENHRQYMKNRRRTDLKCNLNHKINRGIYKSLKGNKQNRHWKSLVGYNLNDLIKRLEKTMPEGYNWQDFLNGKLQIDHKIPISVFNFTKSEHIDFKRCWDLKNLQLLPAKENMIKHNKLTKPFQPALKIF